MVSIGRTVRYFLSKKDLDDVYSCLIWYCSRSEMVLVPVCDGIASGLRWYCFMSVMVLLPVCDGIASDL